MARLIYVIVVSLCAYVCVLAHARQVLEGVREEGVREGGVSEERVREEGVRETRNGRLTDAKEGSQEVHEGSQEVQKLELCLCLCLSL